MKADARLIHVRRAQPPAVRTFWGVLTFLAWMIYAYLLLPLVTLLLWWFGLRDMVGELYDRREQVDPFVVFMLPVLATISSCVLLAWAEYNRLRFRGNERREPSPVVPLSEIANHLGAAPEVVNALHARQVVVVDMDADARPIGILDSPGRRR